jgi:hypothetical protein
MIFVSPETVVESIRPRVRVIQADGIKNFARELSIAKPVFSDMDFRTAVNLLSNPRLPDKTKKRKAATPPPPAATDTSPVPEVITKVDQEIGRAAQRANFTRREWIIIGSLVVLVIIVLSILILLFTGIIGI